MIGAGRGRSSGAAMVEMVLVVMVLLLILVGVIEFGLMLYRYLGISEVARAGARSAALGSVIEVVSGHMNQAALDLGLTTSGALTAIMQYRVYNKPTGTWTGWSTLGNGATGYNSAPCNSTQDSQIRVSITYTYPLATGTFLESMVGSNGNVVLKAAAVMRREATP